MLISHISERSVRSIAYLIMSCDITASKSLVDTYITILKTRSTMNDVIDYAESDRDFEDLLEMVTANAVNETEIFRVSVTSPHPGMSADIANAIANIAPEEISNIIEGSKAFSKNLMKKYGIPTAEYEVFDDMNAALKYLESAPLPTVVKADGLALGKGVIIAETKEDAKEAVREMLEDGKFGESGKRVVIEEFLTGPEVSVLAFTDGESLVPMVSSMDHKRAGDNDTGLNTGGMGTVAPNPYYTDAVAWACMERIFLPTVRAMNAEGRTFQGCLYFGLMITPDGPKVIEYNCRFGDPETQVVLPLLDTDLLTIMQATANGTLDQVDVRFKAGNACCVVLASKGYPAAYEKGYEITMTEEAAKTTYVAGAALKDGKLLTSGSTQRTADDHFCAACPFRLCGGNGKLKTVFRNTGIGIVHKALDDLAEGQRHDSQIVTAQTQCGNADDGTADSCRNATNDQSNDANDHANKNIAGVQFSKDIHAFDKGHDFHGALNIPFCIY